MSKLKTTSATIVSKPKVTSIGQGKHSRPNKNNKKLLRGQGKG